MRIDEADDLRYYWSELRALREQGRAFARRHPKVASRLQLDEEPSPDPHVERLIEAVAFLTGRVQQRLDDDFSDIAEELLGVLSPHLVRPVPSLSIARFDADPSSGRLTTSYPVPAGTPLYVRAGDDVCRFRTCFPVELWPLRVTAADDHPASGLATIAPSLAGRSRVAAAIRVRLEAPTVPFSELPLDRLRFHLDGDRLLSSTLYDLLLRTTLGIALIGEDGVPIVLPRESLAEVGFRAADGMLPTPAWAHPAYSLLQEYFVLPEKHYFFDLTGLSRARAERRLDLIFLLEEATVERLPLEAGTFALGATPIVNLFPRVTEPIRLDHRRLEWRLVPDERRQATTGIYSIDRVTTSADPVRPGRVLEPFYSFTHAAAERDARVFWHARRRPALQGDDEATDVYLSFFDLDLSPSLPPNEIVYAHVLCTNRGLAARVPARARLECDVPGVPLRRVVMLTRPTAPIAPSQSGQALWRLVSNLTLGHLSLGSDESLAALREILTVYEPLGTPENRRQIRAVRSLEPRRVARRVTEDLDPRPLRGFARGLQLTMTLDPTLFSARSPYLFSAVLRSFFALYAPLGSFVELQVRLAGRDEEIWSRWPPMAGERIVA